MFKFQGVEMTFDEWKVICERLQNTYFPVYDFNGKLIDLKQIPSTEKLKEMLHDIREEKTL